MAEFIFLARENADTKEHGILLSDVGIVESCEESVLGVLFVRANQSIFLSRHYLKFFSPDETGDRFERKICDRCFRLLPTVTSFSGNRLKKGDVLTRRPSCKSCRQHKDGVAISPNDKKSWELSKPNQFSLFTCPICQKTTLVGVTKIVLDHCHKTGRVRGWLCESCNTGIGRFDDDPALVNRAIQWLG